MLKYIDEKKLVKIIKNIIKEEINHMNNHVILVYKNTKKLQKYKISDRYKAIVLQKHYDAYE